MRRFGEVTLGDVFGTKERFIEAAAAEGLDKSNCMLIAGLDKVCFAGYLGKDPTTDFEGIGTVNSDERKNDDGGWKIRVTNLSCVGCGQCVDIVDAGEFANVSMHEEWQCPPAAGKRPTSPS